MVGLLDEIKASQLSRIHRLDNLLGTLPDEDRKELMVALKDKSSYTGSQISRALKARGHDIGEGSVRTWRIANGIS